jgi:hypothetical protein
MSARWSILTHFQTIFGLEVHPNGHAMDRSHILPWFAIGNPSHYFHSNLSHKKSPLSRPLPSIHGGHPRRTLDESKEEVHHGTESHNNKATGYLEE